MSAIEKFFAMGGYAAYVWPALAITLLLLGAIWLASWRSARAADVALRRMEAGIDRDEAPL